MDIVNVIKRYNKSSVMIALLFFYIGRWEYMLYIGLLLITSLLLGLNIYKIRLASVIILDKYM